MPGNPLSVKSQPAGNSPADGDQIERILPKAFDPLESQHAPVRRKFRVPVPPMIVRRMGDLAALSGLEIQNHDRKRGVWPGFVAERQPAAVRRAVEC
jgi:hypothetical protein